MSDFVNPNNSKRGDYDKVIGAIAAEKACPFCEDYLVKSEFHKHPLERRNHWWVTDNTYPYKPSKHHVLLIHIQHITQLSEISQDAWVELNQILREQTENRQITGGTFYFRFGDTNYTGASVSHLHANLLQSDPSDPNYDPSKGLIARLG